MIFVTVGTEQFPFDRLIRAVDQAAERLNGESVFIQLGHSLYLPRRCQWAKFVPYPELVERITQARVVISHAGVGSFELCAKLGKVPILVPRRQHFGEHVDDHQVELANRMAQLGYAVVVGQVDDLGQAIREYDQRLAQLPLHAPSQPRLVETLAAYLTDADAGSSHR